MKRGVIDTSYLARVLFKPHQEDGSGNTIFTGTYRLMLRAKSMPSPTSAPNPVEITDFEDDSQTYTLGIKQSDVKEFTGNLDRVYFDPLLQSEGTKVDIIQLYGRDGIGGLAKSGYVGQFTPTVNDLGGTDEVIEMTCSVVQNTSPVWITDDYAVTDNGDGTFTVEVGTGVGDVALDKSNISLVVNNTATIRATTRPSGQTVTWTTSDSAVATVVNGVVTAKAVGTATITATITVDGTNYTDTCAVTVTAGT